MEWRMADEQQNTVGGCTRLNRLVGGSYFYNINQPEIILRQPFSSKIFA
jgi:hypothetical protein